MTPKEKAEELVNNFKFGDVVTEKLQVVNIDIYSNLFALRAVNEIIKEYSNVKPMFISKTPPRLKYWEEVKQEIEKL
jgi:hypothetical protein